MISMLKFAICSLGAQKSSMDRHLFEFAISLPPYLLRHYLARLFTGVSCEKRRIGFWSEVSMALSHAELRLAKISNDSAPPRASLCDWGNLH